MTNQWAIHDERKHGAALCWICNRNEANSGEHNTKRSDLGAVLRAQTQGQPLYFHDLEQRNKPIRSFDAKSRIRAACLPTGYISWTNIAVGLLFAQAGKWKASSRSMAHSLRQAPNACR